jgi:hypothetical protein
MKTLITFYAARAFLKEYPHIRLVYEESECVDMERIEETTDLILHYVIDSIPEGG